MKCIYTSDYCWKVYNADLHAELVPIIDTYTSQVLTLTLILREIITLRVGCLYISYCDLGIIESFENHRMKTLLETTYYSEINIL